jgi:transposase
VAEVASFVEEARVADCPSNLPTEERSFRRVEVLTGTARRRRWSDAEKASIVAESLAAGAVARQVALRHGVHPNQLYAWRRLLAESRSGAGSGGFVPVALSPSGGETAVGRGGEDVAIDIGGVAVRVRPGVELGFSALCWRW